MLESEGPPCEACGHRLMPSGCCPNVDCGRNMLPKSQGPPEARRKVDPAVLAWTIGKPTEPGPYAYMGLHAEWPQFVLVSRGSNGLYVTVAGRLTKCYLREWDAPDGYWLGPLPVIPK